MVVGGSGVKIGLYTKCPMVNPYLVFGEAHYASSICEELSQIPGVQSARCYDPYLRPHTKLDVMIHMNDTVPIPELAKKNILYLQNGYWEGMDAALMRLRPAGYDGYMFISKKLLDLHECQGYKGIYLPFGVDTKIFNPKIKKSKYDYEVSYAGNDIKGEIHTERYLLQPAMKYNFGLFGNWTQKNFAPISKGRLNYQELPFLYSSTTINLNFTMHDQVNWGAMTDRPFQVMACKGFLISDYVPGMEKELENCMIVTEGDLDIVEKIDYYLSRPKERKEIAEYGYQYVLNHATLQARVKTLYSYLQEIV